MKKKFFLFTILTCLILCLERLSYYLADGFKVSNISSNILPQGIWETAITHKDARESKQALLQNYHYLTSGSQSYVFESSDGRYVLKFFKHNRWRTHPLYDLIPLPKKWEKKRVEQKTKKWETVDDMFRSCKASYDLFKTQTGVIFIHINKTKYLQRTITVQDRIGIKHKLNLDDFQFVLQKKAIPTNKYLLKLRQTGEIEKAKKAIYDMLLFTLERAKLGYSDKDPHLIRNFGFIDDEAVEIDVGGFHKDPQKGLSYYKSHEIFKIKRKILPWIIENYPELTQYTEDQIILFSS